MTFRAERFALRKSVSRLNSCEYPRLGYNNLGFGIEWHHIPIFNATLLLEIAMKAHTACCGNRGSVCKKPAPVVPVKHQG